MPLPSAYTEGSLLAFMESVIGPHLVALELDANDQLQVEVEEVQGILDAALAGLTTTADLMKVRTIARWRAWIAAWGAASAKFPLQAGSAKLDESETFRQIKDLLAESREAAMRYDEVRAYAANGSVAYVSAIGVAGDPYGWPVATEFG